MIDFNGRTVENCAGTSRRALLRAGMLGLAGCSLADVLRLEARGAASKSNRSVILVWLDGGPPQHETYDPKPDAPSEFRGPLGAIPTNVPGVALSELFPLQARLMDKMALLRSVHHDNGDHFAAAHWMLTGRLGSNASNLAPMYPSAGSIITKLLGARSGDMPAYVGLPNTHSVGLVPGYHGAAFLGGSFNPFNAPGDPNSPGYRQELLSPPAGIDAGRMEARKSLRERFDELRRSVDGASESGDLDKFQHEAFTLLTSPTARKAFDLETEDPRLRDRYGRTTWGQSALVARRLVEAGARFVTLTFGGWDYHSNLDKGMRAVLPQLDAAVAGLIEDLDVRGRLDDTMVIVMGEFGRTPKINQGLPQDPIPGRDHWGQVMSVAVAGGGLRGGRVVGASNARGEVPRERPLRPQDVLATVYHQLGIDLDHTFLDRTGRPVPVLGNGDPIEELL
ncbi:MAG: DUF1501 domain-containing protein [Isosphaeraceae bacterium]|nr:DUF1501 domain-containing protein [Isosphaeraceae bacterium]